MNSIHVLLNTVSHLIDTEKKFEQFNHIYNELFVLELLQDVADELNNVHLFIILVLFVGL